MVLVTNKQTGYVCAKVAGSGPTAQFRLVKLAQIIQFSKMYQEQNGPISTYSPKNQTFF